MKDELLISDETVMHKICDAARNSPSSIALNHNGIEVSYFKLLAGIDNVYNLINNHVKNFNEIIAIPAIHNINVIVSLLGINYSGNAYLPIDPNWTIERTINILKESKPSMLIYDETDHLEYIKKLRRYQLDNIKFVSLNNKILESPYFDINLIQPKSKPDNLAYVLYTSGSTGIPKGVYQKNESVYNLIAWACTKFVNPKPIVAGIARLTFDLSVLDIFTALSTGGLYHILDESDVKNPPKLLRRIYLTKCNFIQTVPSVWVRLINYLSKKNEKDTLQLTKYYRNIILAGEPLYKSLVKDSFILGFEKSIIWNMYGPTETIHVTANMINQENIKNLSEAVPLGEPIQGVKIKLADENNTFINGSGVGEIHIGGVCVSPDYVNMQSLDKNGFYQLHNENWYETGDFAKRRDDGSIIYIGRRDDQIKIAGKRVHLGELETKALEDPSVMQASAIFDNSNLQLFLYIVLKENSKSFCMADFKKTISEKSESYLIPNKIEVIKKLPLTNNGKIDRKTLLQFENVESKKRRVNITADRWFFVLNEERETSQEHPQVTFILPFLLSKEYLAKRFVALIQSVPYLRLYGDSKTTNTAFILDEAEDDICAKALVDFGENLLYKNILSSIKMMAERPLKFTDYPNFLFGYGMLNNGLSFISLRCHHAIASGSDVIYWVSLLLRGFKPCCQHKSVNSFIWFENNSLNKLSNDINLGTTFYENEKRNWIHIPSKVYLLLNEMCKIKRVSLPTLLFSIHAKIISQLFGPIILEMPFLRNRGKNTIKKENDELASLNVVMKKVAVPAKLTDLSEYIKWATKSMYSSDEVNKDASHRWNLIPVESFMAHQNSKLSLVPLDLYEQLPALLNNDKSSILVQFYHEEIFYVIRMQDIENSNVYANEVVKEILKLVNLM